MQRFKVHSHSQAVISYSQEPTTGSLHWCTIQPHPAQVGNTPHLSLVENPTYHSRTVPDAVENLRKGIALGGMETFGAISKPVQEDSKPTVPFMVMKENRTQSSTEDTLRVVKESIHDSMYESSKTLVKQLDKIGDKLANVVEDFQKKQNSRNSRGRNRDRYNSRSRENSRENYRDNYRNGNRDYYRNRSRDSRDNSRDRDRDRGRRRDRSNSRERKRNQPRSGLVSKIL